MNKYFFLKKSILFYFLMTVPVFLHSQTALVIEEILNMQEVSMQQAAWLVLEAANTSYSANIPYSADTSSQIDAFRYAIEQNWLPGMAEGGDIIRFDQLSYLIMRAFDIRGGIFYSIFRNPHYAYRELVYRNIIFGRTYPGMAVSGYTMLYVVNRVLSYREANLI